MQALKPHAQYASIANLDFDDLTLAALKHSLVHHLARSIPYHL